MTVQKTNNRKNLIKKFDKNIFFTWEYSLKCIITYYSKGLNFNFDLSYLRNIEDAMKKEIFGYRKRHQFIEEIKKKTFLNLL